MTKFPRPAQPVPAPTCLGPKIFTLWRELLSPSLGLSRDGVEVLRGYNPGRWCFMRLHNVSWRKSSGSGLYGHW